MGYSLRRRKVEYLHRVFQRQSLRLPLGLYGHAVKALYKQPRIFFESITSSFFATGSFSALAALRSGLRLAPDVDGLGDRA